MYNNDLYYGGANGIVFKADIGTTDHGNAISFDGQAAWNDFGDPRRKRISAVRPTLETLGIADLQFGIGFDYRDIRLSTTSSTPGVPGSPWDTSPWNTSAWSVETGIDNRWRFMGGTGTAMGYRLRGSTQAALQWLRTDVRYEIGKDL